MEITSMQKSTHLARCTLTGADDTTAHDWLFETGARYPFVEWGILYSDSQQGAGRYPSYEWLRVLLQRMRRTPRQFGFALHICGRAVQDFIEDHGVAAEISKDFGRIQLNLHASRVDLQRLAKAIRQRSHQTIIVQFNKENASLPQALAGLGNHAFLFDTSGGRGLAPEFWPTPLEDSSCGYAGGLGLHNLAQELPKIHHVANGNYWIDMEGRLRDSADCFDTAVAQQVLPVVEDFRRQHNTEAANP